MTEEVDLSKTILSPYDTIIFDLDGVIWDVVSPNGTSMGAYETQPPYELKTADTVIDEKGNTILLQKDVRKVLDVLDENDVNMGIVSRGQKLVDVQRRIEVPYESQPSIMLLKKFDIHKYFNYDIILKAFAIKSHYVKPLGKTLFIDDDQVNINDVKGKDEVDVLWRKSFTDWLQILQPKSPSHVSSILSWKKEETLRRIKVTEDNRAEIIREISYAFFTDLGSIIYINSNNELHNPNGPSIEREDGTKYWFVNGRFVGKSNDEFTDEDFENYKREHNITSSLKLSWRTHENFEANATGWLISSPPDNYLTQYAVVEEEGLSYHYTPPRVLLHVYRWENSEEEAIQRFEKGEKGLFSPYKDKVVPIRYVGQK